ncbi:MAG: hypothetical protein UU51_C0001G0027 [Microgenomates group bacterium GW2011_GWC1_41_20]|uniref:Glycosyltransferase RgtA/B/C/D-like domain-containing protein n=3 Tax=Candidatus Woeseibacteriota TaxID=1752722 RepID=A0A0G0WWK5_9BACT|nr:MAG: hypothetical protein UU51_C0001G0027 [Microgenomates group bacterium GW2011_GWC1_41_20]KKS05793.1 MAG: hypothetical protein UU57_C0001G0058 [Candidatus Woesebacteria bacterium GW2011_GWE1_41_24]KKS16532.1 MAG: hypothetical protein UU74_C0040G0008 [Candidatus Woesebacteria bacterium GW2011_GWA1_41_7]OGM83621.1 MAG: hypothetical protein A2434_02760 [Candidatus Woesebacteria bacterium RIFOXYC1_FULL_41_14]OGM87587.1 MAG: hypothetical protein A2594_00235 [Candidatus Woesebacteria bacterium R
MREKITKHKWFLLSLILAVLLAFYRFNQGVIQQDNYMEYARHLPFEVGKISFYDSRLLPGLPILIYLLHFLTGDIYVAGYLLMFIFFGGSYLLLYKLTHSPLSFVPLIFPPILLNLASLIDTEYPFIFLIVLSYFLTKSKNFKWAFLIIGISVWFRLAGLAVLAGVFIYMALKKKFGKFLLNLPYFVMPVLLLTLYNIYFYGSGNPFYQLFTYQALHPERISMGIVQLGQDVLRAFRWQWYRILVSGIFYIFVYFYLYLKSFKNKTLEFWIISSIYLFTLTVNLVPFLENLGRYLAPTIPLFWLMFHSKLKSSNILYLALPISVLAVFL